MANLKKTIEMFELEFPNEAYPKLKQYCQALWEVNRQLNLTRHTTYELFVTRDLLDTIELSKLIPAGKEVLDVGSGGGVPGMLLAILRPDLKIYLTDSVGKKAAALGDIAEAVGISCEIFHCRAEELLEDFRFDYSTARAVGPLKKMGTWFADCWPSVGRMLAVKGPRWIEEKAEADELKLFHKVDVRVLSQYEVPGVEWKSVILQLKASS